MTPKPVKQKQKNQPSNWPMETSRVFCISYTGKIKLNKEKRLGKRQKFYKMATTIT